jgi:molybdopterin converting factor small subunit
MSTVTLRYWAAAKQAAGVAEETISARTLAAALEAVLSAREGNRAAGTDCDLRAVLARSSFLVDGSPVGSRAPETVRLREAAVVEVLPPFAGG